MHYYKSNRPALLGDDKTESTSLVSRVNNNDNVKLAAGAALVFHGYRRTGSVLWALVYGLVGRANPLVGGAVAAAQGFGKKKGS